MYNKELLRRHLAELEASEVPMSQSDSVVITTYEPDAPGVYVDAMQNYQDAYGQQLLAMKAAQEAAALLASQTPVIPIVNPNVTYVESPQRMGCSSDGNHIVIY